MVDANLVYHVDTFERLQELIYEDVNNDTLVLVSTTCPQCNERWYRDAYLCTPPGVLILEVCEKCDLEDVFIINYD